MATRMPKGPVAAATPKKAVAKSAPVPPAPVPPVEETAAQAAVQIEPPVETPVAHAVEEVTPEPATPPAPVEAPPVAAAPVAVEAEAIPAPKPAKPKPVAKPAAPKAAPAAATRIEPPAKPVEQAIAQTKEKVEKMSKQVFATFEDVVGFQKDNVEAFVASSTILTKGFEALSKELVAFTQAQYEQSVATTKALFAVKSVKELVDLQTEFAKTSFDALVAEATKVSETGIKVANEAAEPITARVNATVEKLSKLKAA
ncbi:phasin family protein [Niveispirillum sp.]|uniref:phasin family protein n=1 Tax=Niveispirillum sp. TaxID=1917217 RepID=UPI001B727139|nr:phasin family protein [Niveispirillum sp.]MBP7334683.1 phasin family protein [Niveispirillum sp.]